MRPSVLRGVSSNPTLSSRTEASRQAALRISAKTSSAVEGIRAPFAASAKDNALATQCSQKMNAEMLSRAPFLPEKHGKRLDCGK